MREAVRFSADLRLASATAGRSRSRANANAAESSASAHAAADEDATLAAHVDATLAALGLTAVADTPIGMPTMGGLSHEVRKRVTIAVELVARPRVLFCDEPTTGLDASSALAIMTTVRALATRAGITVLCTIHQPSSTILALFDTLLVLESGGRVAYHGPTQALPAYMASLKMGEQPVDLSSTEARAVGGGFGTPRGNHSAAPIHGRICILSSMPPTQEYTSPLWVEISTNYIVSTLIF